MFMYVFKCMNIYLQFSTQVCIYVFYLFSHIYINIYTYMCICIKYVYICLSVIIYFYKFSWVNVYIMNVYM